ncbi:MAG: hypothetical protein JW801_00910 [Bacteroidales bacterium]|nr:hypothetical protein [Bacteroidales bacterium]
MKSYCLKELSDLELVQRLRKIKNNIIIDASIVGFTIGIAIYGAVKNGLEIFTFLPLILAYVIIKNSGNNKILEKEMRKELDSRNFCKH